MNSDFKHVIGLMSGTSLDGLDLVYVKFDSNDYQNFEILSSQTKAYTDEWKHRLAKGIHKSTSELIALDKDYGCLLADYVNEFISDKKIVHVDFIASHGHTILHQPDKGITLQVGNGQIMTDKTNQQVICDFRTQDVELGGQGAPLVPIGDELLFSNFDACLNLGGFANISFKENGKRIAFDICPVNIVMNYYVQKLGMDYDDKGRIAASGTVNQALLDRLNDLEFYTQKPPKSLGLEWVQEHVFPVINEYNLGVKDVLRTFLEHVVIQLANSLQGKENVLITGGGVFNDFLIERLLKISRTKIVIPETNLIEYKEALIFAFLGLLRFDNQVNCLSSVTGAKHNHSSGKIFHPKKS
jgi:anhydro-N-acetylmuramic acid kinase